MCILQNERERETERQRETEEREWEGGRVWIEKDRE